jgi:hypothetical protein
MNCRISLYDAIVNGQLMVRVYDLDNEGRKGKVQVSVSGHRDLPEVEVDHLSLNPVDIFIPGVPLTGRFHEVNVRILDGDGKYVHDTDTRMIKLGK